MLSACVSERSSNDLNLKTIWITWDDWQGLYRIDSVCIASGLDMSIYRLEVNFFWAGEPIEGIIRKTEYNNNTMSTIITYDQRPNFLKTKFAFNNPIFLPERDLSNDTIEKIIRTHLSYSLILNETSSDRKQLEEQSNINIDTRLKYIFID